MLAGAYRGEVSFYADLAATVAVVVPRCHYAAIRAGTGEFTLLLEDLAPAEQGDQLAGCTAAQARAAVVNLAGLHGPRWCDPTLLDVQGLSVNGPEDAAVLPSSTARPPRPSSTACTTCSPTRTSTPCAAASRSPSAGRSRAPSGSRWCTATTGSTT